MESVVDNMVVKNLILFVTSQMSDVKNDKRWKNTPPTSSQRQPLVYRPIC